MGWLLVHFEDDQTEVLGGGRGCCHSASLGAAIECSRPSHCGCQAGLGGEPVSVMKSPRKWR